jgi:thiol-disulfide isomerase/thioredoxin
VTGLSVKGDRVSFAIELAGREAFNFDGVLAADGKKLVGSVSKFGGALGVTELFPSKLKKLTDPIDLAREDFAQLDVGQPLFDAGFLLAGKAAEKKMTPEEARGLADKLTKSATLYGARWERTVAVRLASAFAEQEGFADVALSQAQRAERMLTDDAPVATQMEVIETVARALTKAGKAEDAKKYAATLAKLELRDATEYAKSVLTFDTPEYKGRMAKSDRVALVEVFTGAECPPCVAVDVAFDALLKSYKPSDVVFVQYHIHVPGPDPLTSPEGMERGIALFGERLSAPAVLINGKPVGRGGGPATAGKAKYTEFSEALNAALETPAAAKLTLTVAKDEKGHKATAKVTDLEKPGEKVALRFAVVEEQVRYAGGNGARFHHRVVRSMPGGIKGFPMTKKDGEQSVTVNADDIRKGLTKYLADFAKNEGEFPRSDRPLALKNLKLIAFVQNDETGEVLNAAQVDLEAK